MGDWEDALRRLIKERYGSLRAFTTQAELPYTTIYNMLNRGISNSAIETVTTFYNALNIDWQSMSDFTNPDYSLLRLKPEPAEAEEAVGEYTSDECELINSYRRLSESDKEVVRRIMLALESVT